MDTPVTITLDDGGDLTNQVVLTVQPMTITSHDAPLYAFIIQEVPSAEEQAEGAEVEDVCRLIVSHEALGNLVRTLGAEGIV